MKECISMQYIWLRVKRFLDVYTVKLKIHIRIKNDNNDKKLNVELMPVVKNNGAKGGDD